VIGLEDLFRAGPERGAWQNSWVPPWLHVGQGPTGRPDAWSIQAALDLENGKGENL